MLASDAWLSRMQDDNVVTTDQENGGQKAFSFIVRAAWEFVRLT
jgi:hypothetical protein